MQCEQYHGRLRNVVDHVSMLLGTVVLVQVILYSMTLDVEYMQGLDKIIDRLLIFKVGLVSMDLVLL